MLCFGFVMRTVLIALRFLAIAEPCFHMAKTFPAPPARSMGVHKKLGGDTVGTGDPNQPKGYPTLYDMPSNKGWEKREEGGDVLSDGACLPKQPLHVMQPCFSGDG